MPFRPRNAYYLRISAHIVLPIYLYLDERHIEWMSDVILQYVLADLRPLIFPKLQAESSSHFGPGGPANAKRGTVDVHRGDAYQFAYFFRRTEPHSIVLKTRTFAIAPSSASDETRTSHASISSSGKSKATNKRASRNLTSSSGRKRQRKGKGRARNDVQVSEEETEDEGNDIQSLSDRDANDGAETVNQMTTTDPPRRSQRRKSIVAGGYQEEDPGEDVQFTQNESMEADLSTAQPYEDIHPQPAAIVERVQVKDEESDPPLLVALAEAESEDNSLPQIVQAATQDDETEQPTFELHIEEEEEKKPKLLLRLKYDGFNISGLCLCIVVEPWPPVRSTTRAPSTAPLQANVLRRPNIAPPDFVPTGGVSERERTPLFLPELGRGRSETPAPFLFRGQTRPPVPLFSETAPDRSDDEDDGYDSDGLMQFSQSLNSNGNFSAQLADDDDEMDGAVLFGDADEMREL